MLDQAFAYIGTVLEKIRNFHAPISLEEITSRAGLSRTDLNEYEIITQHSTSPDPTSDDEDDELGYALARSVPFPNIRRTIDAASISETQFPMLFHQQIDTLTSDSLSFIQRRTPQYDDPLEAFWTKTKENEDDVSVYRKVADWVFAQRNYFHRFDPEDADDIEVIDPVDLFHDSLLDEYLLLTRSSSEKRLLLRELHEHSYNVLSVHEAIAKYEYDFLRKPESHATLELSRLGIEDNDTDEEKETTADIDQAFLAVSTVLRDYSIYDRDGCELFDVVDDHSYGESANSDESISSETEEENSRSPDVNELDIVSLRFSEILPRNFDERTSITYPTDVFDITTIVLADNAIDNSDSDSDIWEDAKDIPHWLDCEQEDQLFTQPHRPFYYYRDRIKGCYRIIGVEDETVVLFSGNDDDSIFYNTETDDGVSALRRSHSLGLLSPLAKKRNRGKLFSSPSRPRTQNSSTYLKEKRNDSGIEDAEDSVLGDNMVETSFSAKECFDLGRVTKIIRNKEQKTVTFRLERPERGSKDFVFVFFGIVLMIISILCFLFDIFEVTANIDDLQHICQSLSWKALQ